MKQRIPLLQSWRLRQEPLGEWMDIPVMPSEVHEILHALGRISDDFLIGLGEESRWVAETDWIYECRFPLSSLVPHMALAFQGLDTIAEITLNGEKIGSAQSLYLPLYLETDCFTVGENILEIRFESPYSYLRKLPFPPEWEGKVRRTKLLRKPQCDFNDYLGARPYLTPIGVAGPVELILSDCSELLFCDMDAYLQEDYQNGSMECTVWVRQASGLTAHVILIHPNGTFVGECGVSLLDVAPQASAPYPWGMEQDGSKERPPVLLTGTVRIPILNPALWWPRGFGGQPLYTVRVELSCKGKLVDSCTKQIGFRRIQMNQNFDFHINDKSVRLWGSNLPPLDGTTHRYNHERACALLDLVELANMNTLRIWGEGEPFDDRLYEECDRRGILLWQEFYHYYGMQPDTESFTHLCLKEAACLIWRLRHHPSIFMWCGGNEGIMGGEFEYPGEPSIGSALYLEQYGALCKKIDPSRYYHANSPLGGTYANDPRAGDTHGYEMWWHVPGGEYPVAFTEHMRVSTPALKSIKKFISEDEIWPAGFVDSTTYLKQNTGQLPHAWMARAGGMLALKAGPVEQFRDADSAEELIYKYAAAHAASLALGIARSRMGRPSGQVERICKCHLIWKLSDTWPLIYSAVIDYYLEPFLPYYAARRGYSPVAVCFDIRDTSYLWLVNDTSKDLSGEIEYGVFSPGENCFVVWKKISVTMSAGSSGEVACLDELGAFRSENIFYARFLDQATRTEAEAFGYVDIERRLLFPEASLRLAPDGEGIRVESDRFAHCVELSGDADGEEFGWTFEDNYFDLLPGRSKRVRILGRHNRGNIFAKAHVSPYQSKICWERSPDERTEQP